MATLRIGGRAAPLLIALSLAASGGAGPATAQQAAPPERPQPGLLGNPMRGLKVATLDLPQPLGSGVGPGVVTGAPAAPLSSDGAPANGDVLTESEGADLPLVFGPTPARPSAYLELALDVVLTLPGIDDMANADDSAAPPAYGPDIANLDSPRLDPADGAAGDDPAARADGEGRDGGELAASDLDGAEAEAFAQESTEQNGIAGDDSVRQVEAAGAVAWADPAALDPGPVAATAPLPGAEGTGAIPLHNDPVAVFGRDPGLFPPLAFEHLTLAALGPAPLPMPKPMQDLAAGSEAAGGTAGEAAGEAAPGRLAFGLAGTPADRLSLEGAPRARAEKCLAEAIYFESRGEPKRGQVAVAQVVMNRVFSGYYPNDVCKAVYQNAHRRLACQFTFACDDVKDVVREPDMWVQAKEIASDMLDGKLWIPSVGRATHYHAYWVHPSWVREMRRLDRIGVHTFYRPRRWGEG